MLISFRLHLHRPRFYFLFTKLLYWTSKYFPLLARPPNPQRKMLVNIEKGAHNTSEKVNRQVLVNGGKYKERVKRCCLKKSPLFSMLLM